MTTVLSWGVPVDPERWRAQLFVTRLQRNDAGRRTLSGFGGVGAVVTVSMALLRLHVPPLAKLFYVFPRKLAYFGRIEGFELKQSVRNSTELRGGWSVYP